MLGVLRSIRRVVPGRQMPNSKFESGRQESYTASNIIVAILTF